MRRYVYVLPGICLTLAIAIGVAAYRYYRSQEAQIESGVRRQLAAIAELKVQQVVSWRNERFADAKMLGSAQVMPTVQSVLEGRGGKDAADRVLAWMQTVKDASQYTNCILVDSAGRVRLAVGPRADSDSHYSELARQAVERGQFVFSDIHYDTGLAGPHMGLNVPLRFALGARAEGALLMGVDPARELFRIVLSWPTPSRTAEALLVRRDGDTVVFLNELRHRRGVALKLRLPLTNTGVPAVLAGLGREGVVQGVDYRGASVLAAIKKVPDSPWSLVVKQDLEEIYLPVHEQALWLALIACALCLAIATVVALVSRTVKVRFDRQKQEAELHRQALLAHFDYLSRFANDIILLIDPEARVVEANDRALNAYGYSRDELIGMPLRELRDSSAQADYEQHWRAVGDQGGLVFETLHRRKDGTTFPVEVSARRIDVEGVTLTQSIIRDITERKLAEEERARLQEQLLQAQKMESVGRLAGGVAHDFNNLLTVINGYAAFAQEELPAEHPLHQPVSEIAQAGQRAAGLTQQLLAFSRKQVLAPKVLDVNDVVRDVTKMLRRLVGEDIRVITHLAPEPARVLADETQVQQILMNLAANARDAMPGGGTLVIETECLDMTERYAASHADSKTGHHVLLTVTDTGTGMEKETRERAFDPFFTTKCEGQGTGLGLSTVYGIVRQSGGWICLYSEPGRGTAFKIYLPRVFEAPQDETAAPRAADLRGSETILVVEDQPDVRRLAVEVLARHGYRLLEARDAREALRVCDSRLQEIDLLLTDIVMPGMTGRELSERLLARRPELKVLYMSGYTANVVVQDGVLENGAPYLAKPFTPTALAAKVRELLDSGGR